MPVSISSCLQPGLELAAPAKAHCATVEIALIEVGNGDTLHRLGLLQEADEVAGC
jgi:hypothetical protein